MLRYKVQAKFLYGASSEDLLLYKSIQGALVTRVSPDTIRCAWTGQVDLNTLRMDGEIFKTGKKKLQIQKYPDTCGRGLNIRLKKLFKMSDS